LFKPKELRVCNQCGLLMGEKDVRRHSLITGHVSFSIVRISLEELFKRILELELEVKKLDKRVENIEEKMEKGKEVQEEQKKKKKAEELFESMS